MLRSFLVHASWSSRSRLSNLEHNHIAERISIAGIHSFSASENGRISHILQIISGLFTHQSESFDSHLGLLRKGIRNGDFHLGASLHGFIVKSGLLGFKFVMSNAVVDLYAKLGVLSDCFKAFDEMPLKDVASWCTLITGCVRRGFHLEAIEIFKQACHSDVKINHFVISSVLNACSGLGTLNIGTQVHGFIAKKGLGFDRFVEAGLVDMYSKCGDLKFAVKLFYEIPIKNVISWNVMISGYRQNGFFIEALTLSIELCKAGFFMDLVTIRLIATMISSLGLLHLSKNLHAYSIKIGLSSDTYVVSEHIKLLAKFGDVDSMRKLFVSVKNPDTSMYAILISGYSYNNQRDYAVQIVSKLLMSRLKMNEGVVVNILNLCSCKYEATQVHGWMIKTGQNLYISIVNVLIVSYIDLFMMASATMLFYEMPHRDVITWTTLMSGHVRNLNFIKALELFSDFRRIITQNEELDPYILSTGINACSGVQSITHGSQIHSLSLQLGFTASNFLNTALIHMYMKCGFPDLAAMVFSFLSSLHDLVAVNIMLAGYLQNLQPKKTLELFSQECWSGFIFNELSYSTVLHACTCLRLSETGEQVHSRIIKAGLQCSDIIIGNTIVKHYFRLGHLRSAVKSFDEMKIWNLDSYFIIILVHLQCGNIHNAARLLQHCHHQFRQKPMVFLRFLRVCVNLVDKDSYFSGEKLHTFVVKSGYGSNIFLDDALKGMHLRFNGKSFGRLSDVLSAKHKMKSKSKENDHLCAGSSERGIVGLEKFLPSDFNFLNTFFSNDSTRGVFFESLSHQSHHEIEKDPFPIFERIVLNDIIPPKVSWKNIASE
ncbi:hypothetical protein ZOSMA_1G01420 [Zostera marina]|uniref:Pentatricopeptide repeat-containing protein n=1 Tax=Zostera marina TaxID=29655 RepID=A0A0K9PMJ7_ZOSMR|nr:hypothetical protein ZOSMA_1G01420 [Zostera marina]